MGVVTLYLSPCNDCVYRLTLSMAKQFNKTKCARVVVIILMVNLMMEILYYD